MTQLAILYLVAALSLLTGWGLCSALTLAKGNARDQARDDEAQLEYLRNWHRDKAQP